MNLTVIVGAAAGAGGLLLVLLIGSGARVVREHERGVVFRLGRMRRMWRPGLHWMVPLGVDRLVRVDARISVVEVRTHDAVTLDQAIVRLVADVYYQVVEPQLAVSKVASHRTATAAVAEAQLRGVVAKVSLDDLLSMRPQLTPVAAKVIDDEVEPWGVRIVNVEITDVLLSDAMQQALLRQAEAARERRTKIAAAESELEAARALSEAAGMMTERPAALQLRYLQTLSEIGNGRSTVVVFPVPIDLLQTWLAMPPRVTNGHAEPEILATGHQHTTSFATRPPASEGPAQRPAPGDTAPRPPAADGGGPRPPAAGGAAPRPAPRSAGSGAPVTSAAGSSRQGPPPVGPTPQPPPPVPPQWPDWYRPG